MPDGVTTALLDKSTTVKELLGNTDSGTVRIAIELVAAIIAQSIPGPNVSLYSELAADLAWDEPNLGAVWGDTDLLNGVYKKNGATGVGSWSRIGDLPMSAATLAALAAKAPIASPALTGVPTAPTAVPGTDSTQIATTAFTRVAIEALVAAAPGALDTLNELAAALGDDPNFATTMVNSLALKAPTASPALTGVPTAPTAVPGTDSTQIATTAFTRAAIEALVAAAPGALDTLNELAAALGDDPNFATTMVNSLALKAPVADLSAEVNRAISVENLLAQPQRNMLPHADFSDATVGPLGLVALTANANLPGWVPAITISATLGLPATEVVDDFWWPQSQRSRAVKATMVRSNSGTDTTDLQLRQVFEIPEALQGQAELEVTFVYNYLVNNGGIAVFSAGLWSADNEAMTGSEYLAWARQNDRVVGEAGTAVFRATIAAPTATHIKTGPRLRVNVPGGGEGGGTSDINEDAWIGPCAVYFQQPNRVEWSPSEEDDARAETQRVNTAFEARISRPASQIGNVLENGALIELDANGEVPPGWSTLFGGGGSKVAAWRTVEVPGLPSAVDANGFEVDHEYDGTNHTDLQLQQIIRVPDRLWDVPGTSVTMVQYVKLDEYVSGSLVVVPEDLTGAIVGSLTYPDDVSEDVGNGWEKISYVMEIGSGVRQLDTRFRTSCSNSDGVLTGLNSYQSLFSAVFNAPDYVDDYEPNAWDDATRLARNEIKADRDALGIPTRSDYYADANGNFLQIVPDADLVVLGDSQTDSYEDEVGDALPGRPIIDAGIGGEWVGTHILNRMRGHSLDDLPTFSGAGTYRMRTKRAVPPRCISESNRGQWTEYGLKIAEPRFVEFSNADGLIGRSYAQEQALVTVSGATLTDADGHPFANGDEVYVLQDSVPGNMYRAKAYYVRDVSGNDFGLAEFSGGAAISFDAFGGSMAVLGGFYFDWAWNGSDDTTITVKTVTNWSEKTILLNGGTNDIGGGASASQVCSAYDAIAAEQRTLAKRIMFETIPGFWKSGGEWEIGGAFYAEMADVHAYIKRRYPDMVADT